MTHTTDRAADTPARTRDERAARGRAARSVAPRSSHTEFARPPGLPALLSRQDTRRSPQPLPTRHGRMAVATTPCTGPACGLSRVRARTGDSIAIAALREAIEAGRVSAKSDH